MPPLTHKKCAVALSGGVDSAVTAHLLKQAGYQVTGIFAINWPESRCCGTAQQDDVAKVAAALNIPLLKIDVMLPFTRGVVDRFVKEYEQGKTPNPCTHCNRTIRFGVLWDQIKDLGFAFMASGHYANIEYDDVRKAYLLKKAKDHHKDQTYMLYGLSQIQLARTRTPLGNFTKQEVRTMARQAELPVADKEDSQDVCFVQKDYGTFLKQYTGKSFVKGEVVTEAGKVLGEHEGIQMYTIGQRRGLGIAAPDKLYVTRIDSAQNRVVVGPEASLYQSELVAGELHWILPGIERELDHHTLQIEAQIRYNSTSSSCTIRCLSERRVEVHLTKPIKAITPGQAIVFYLDDCVLGGAIIETGGNVHE